MTVLDYERECEQVRAAIARHAERHADETPGDSDVRRFGGSAFGLAICAVILLARERSTSVEHVLDELIEGR